eukprot:5693574-Prymnesium_polylepis.1
MRRFAASSDCPAVPIRLCPDLGPPSNRVRLARCFQSNRVRLTRCFQSTSCGGRARSTFWSPASCSAAAAPRHTQRRANARARRPAPPRAAPHRPAPPR